jgi:hypothetical protein
MSRVVQVLQARLPATALCRRPAAPTHRSARQHLTLRTFIYNIVVVVVGVGVLNNNVFRSGMPGSAIGAYTPGGYSPGNHIALNCCCCLLNSRGIAQHRRLAQALARWHRSLVRTRPTRPAIRWTAPCLVNQHNNHNDITTTI